MECTHIIGKAAVIYFMDHNVWKGDVGWVSSLILRTTETVTGVNASTTVTVTRTVPMSKRAEGCDVISR